MQNYTLNNDEIWCLIPKVPISLEELQILSKGNDEEKKQLIAELNKKKELVRVKGKELKLCNEMYAKYKPKLNNNDSYKLISFDFSTDGIIFLGAYNYILNKRPIHIQIN
jgi:hypothetical protein